MLWAFLTLTLVLIVFKYSASAKTATADPDDFLGLLQIPKNRRLRVIGWSIVASILIAINWLVFVWCVQSHLIVESSLGYFVNPLMSVALGVIVLGEKIRWTNWIAIGFAASGVGYLTWLYGSIPYLALMLALSFGLYGLVKKRASLAAIPGLWLETMMLLLPAVAYLGYRSFNGDLALGSAGFGWDLLIISTGPVTTVPLLLFAYSATRIPLSTMGLLQYIAPSIQFWMGWYVMQEKVSVNRWYGFILVWMGLAVFVVSSLLHRTKRLEPAIIE